MSSTTEQDVDELTESTVTFGDVTFDPPRVPLNEAVSGGSDDG